jgi:hypothetical protein
MSSYFKQTHLFLESEKNRRITRKEGAKITETDPKIYSSLLTEDTPEVKAFLSLLSNLTDEEVIHVVSLYRQDSIDGTFDI